MAAELMIIDLIISGLGKEMLFMANTAFCELIQVLSFIMQAYKDNFFLFRAISCLRCFIFFQIEYFYSLI